MLIWRLRCQNVKCKHYEEFFEYKPGTSEGLWYVGCPECSTITERIENVYLCDRPGCDAREVQAPKHWFHLSLGMDKYNEGGSGSTRVLLIDSYFHSLSCYDEFRKSEPMLPDPERIKKAEIWEEMHREKRLSGKMDDGPPMKLPKEPPIEPGGILPPLPEIFPTPQNESFFELCLGILGLKKK